MSAFKTNRSFRKPYSRPADGQWLHDKAPGSRKSLNGEVNTIARSIPTANTKLLISNLHYEVTPKDLSSIFGQIGTLVREPLIRYDRSGRSSGTAIVSYETATEATRAKKQFDGVLAKGQPMTIEFDTSQPRRVVSAPTTVSLLNRIQKPPLAARLSGNLDSPKSGPGPIRSRPRLGPKLQDGGNKRSGPKKPKTAEELDKELDAFMGDAEPGAVQNGAQQDGTTSSGAPVQDVEMA